MTPFPPGTTLSADPSLQVRDRGRLLLGGAPMRIIRVSESGATVVRSWLEGRPVADAPGAVGLARRLTAAGMLHPHPPGPTDAPPPGWSEVVTVVIPVRDDPDGLDLTLDRLGRSREPATGPPVTVVDDGSVVPVADRSGIRLLRRAVAGGPGVARQDALDDGVPTPLVAFVDAGVAVTADQLRRLARWFDDPAVVAVAPRVATSDHDHPLTAYERDHSPLDLGGAPSPVGPGRMVSYLPTACLLARTGAVVAAGGFDPALRYGEDVDLVWRLAGRGEIRYDPSVVVHHPARPTLRALLAQRLAYGRSAAPLAARHGSAVAPIRLSRWSLAIWLLALTGRPAGALALAGVSGSLLRRKLAPVVPDSGGEAARLVAIGHWWAGRHLADTAVRAWWPLTVAALLARPTRAVAARLVAWAWIRRLVGSSGGVEARLRRLALEVLDDAAYGAGVWQGAWHQRSIRCLLPVLAEWPGDRPLDGGPPTDR